MNPNTMPANSSIPRLFHQIWYQGEHALPQKYRRYRQSWIKHHPDWEFRLWDAKMLQAHVDRYYPWFSDRYASFPSDIQRIDSARYCFLASYGGFYVDMDIECLRPIDSLLPGHDLILSRTYGYNNALIGSARGHLVWKNVFKNLREARSAPLENIPKSQWNSPAIQTAITVGPRFFTMCVEQSGHHRATGVLNCPGYYFEPGAPTSDHTSWPPAGDPNGSFARHDMDLNWMAVKDRILSKIMRVVTPRIARLLSRS
jgi:mannosyltransferase OCH1-like enzyme